MEMGRNDKKVENQPGKSSRDYIEKSSPQHYMLMRGQDKGDWKEPIGFYIWGIIGNFDKIILRKDSG